MTISLLNLRKLVGQEFSPLPFLDGTSDASGNSTTTITDAREFGKFPDRKLRGAWLHLEGITPQDYLISANVQSTELVTFGPTAAAAPDSQKYQIMAFPAEDINKAIEEAIREAHNRRWLQEVSWHTIYADSPIINAGFDAFDSSDLAEGWTAETVTVVSMESVSEVDTFPGFGGIKLSSSSDGSLDLDNPYQNYLRSFVGQTVKVHAWVISDTASSGKVRLLGDNTELVVTETHAGDGIWSLISSADVNVADTVTKLSIHIERGGSATMRVGAVWVEGGRKIRHYPIPPAVLDDDEPLEVREYPMNILPDKDNVEYPGTIYRKIAGVRVREFTHSQSSTNRRAELVFEKELPRANSILQVSIRRPMVMPTTDAGLIPTHSVASVQLLTKLAARVLVKRSIFAAGESARAAYQEFLDILDVDIQGLTRNKLGQDNDAAILPPRW